MSLAGNEPCNPVSIPQFRHEVGATVKIILAHTERCGGGKSGDSDAAASRLVRNGLASLSFDSFSRSYHLPSRGHGAIIRHAFELFTDGCDNAGSGDWVSQWVRFAKNEESTSTRAQYIYTNCICPFIRFERF